MKRPSRRVAAGLVAALVAVALAVTAWFVFLRGDQPEDVAEEYLTAIWAGDWTVECELASEQWKPIVFGGYPFANCADFAKAAEKANRDNGFEEFRDDTDVVVTVEEFSSGDGKARVGYIVEFRYRGEDQAGFDELWQGGSAVDRGTVELAEIDGDWLIAGVDAG